jgi:hypothetical protein
MNIAEIFGFGTTNTTEAASKSRAAKICPFRKSNCTKSSKVDPFGICSLSSGNSAAALCPVRFLEGNRIFRDAGRIAFGEGVTIAVFPEIRILKIPAKSDHEKEKKIGKVDFLIGHIQENKIINFAALEVQAAYFSGVSLRGPFNHFLQHGNLESIDDARRPDFRSSAQKRLAPQLSLKVPVFSRWGKKFFVVVDSLFFASLPAFAQTSKSNSELTWLAYPIEKQAIDYQLGNPAIVYSAWNDVQYALIEGSPPEPDEIYLELQTKFDKMQRQGTICIEV